MMNTLKNRAAALALLISCAGWVFAPASAHARVKMEPAAAVPDLSSCKALSDADSYADKYEGFQYLIQGKDGWLFRTKQDLRSEFKISDDAIALFKRLTTELKAHGTELVIAYPPTRGMVASQYLPDANPLMDGYTADAARANYTAFIKAMNDAGVMIVGNPTPKNTTNYFYKTDMHWTTEGAQEMAQVIADHVKTLAVYGTLPKTEFVTTKEAVGFPESHFNKALKGLCDVEMPQEIGSQTKTVAKLSTSGNKDDLFGKGALADIVLVGTSNSNRDDYDMNFSGRLKQALSVDVQNAAIAGGGIDDSLLNYLTSDEFAKQPAKVLLWEIPSYYNLAGEEARRSLKQALAVLVAADKKPTITSEARKISGSDASFFAADELKSVTGQDAVLELRFDKPFKKTLTITVKDSKDKDHKIKIGPSRDQKRLSVFYMLDEKVALPLTSVKVKAIDEIKGITFTALLYGK